MARFEKWKIIRVPLAYKERLINLNCKRNAMTIPWGDVFTAYHSTGIPNIEFYFSRPRKSVKRIKRIRSLLPLFNRKWIIKMLQNRIERKWKQPTDELRRNGKSLFGVKQLTRAATRSRPSLPLRMDTMLRQLVPWWSLNIFCKIIIKKAIILRVF